MSHVTVAASARAFRKMFEGFRDNFTFSDSNSGNFGPFSASYAVSFHLDDGTIELRNDNTVRISELDIKWDVLRTCIGFDIQEICIVGGWCILPNPLPFGPDCLIEFPRICVFSANPDINVCLDLSGIVTSEVSVTARPVIRYRVDPLRTPAMSDLDAEDANSPNKWQVFIDPITVDIDLFDVADIVGDLLEQTVTDAINNLLPGPDWLKNEILARLGPIIDLIRGILDLPDDIEEWLSNLLGISLGLFNTIVTPIADYFANQNPIHEIEDPYPILDSVSGIPGSALIPVKIPIRDLTVQVNSHEMVIEANVGA